jgi:hypothetical protein
MSGFHVHLIHIYDPADHLYTYGVNSSRRGAIERVVEVICEQLSEDVEARGDYAKALRRSIRDELPVGRTHLGYRSWHAHIDEVELGP